MFCHQCKCCLFSWLSGVFALAALVHVVRLIVRAQVQVGGWPVPMGLSVSIAVIAGTLSLVFCKMGCKVCSCASK